jgi:hypothetical protein
MDTEANHHSNHACTHASRPLKLLVRAINDALCYTKFTFVAALLRAIAAAVDPPFCTVPASIECALQTTGVRDPAAVTETLMQAERI